MLWRKTTDIPNTECGGLCFYAPSGIGVFSIIHYFQHNKGTALFHIYQNFLVKKH